MPPFAAMMSAIFSIAGSTVESPTVLAVRRARSLAMASPSRTRSISFAIRRGELVAINQPRSGRRTSPPISWTRPMPRILKSRSSRGPRLSTLIRSSMTRVRQSMRPLIPTPLASHRSCHVLPGCISSQSSTLSRVSFRLQRVLESCPRNGGVSIRATTVARDWRVAGQLFGLVRGGNFFQSASASALSCQGRAATASVMVLVVTAAPARTARPGSPDGSAATAPRAPSASPPDDDGGPGPPR